MKLFLISTALGVVLNSYGTVMDDFVYTYAGGNQCIFTKTSAEAQTIYDDNKNKDSYDSVADNAFGTTIDGKTTLKKSFRVSNWLVNMAREILEKEEMETAFNGIKYENLRFRGEKISYTIIEKLLDKSNLKANNDPDKNIINDANMYYNGWYLKARFDFEKELNKKINNIENENLKKFCKLVQIFSRDGTLEKKFLTDNLDSINKVINGIVHPDKHSGISRERASTLNKALAIVTGNENIKLFDINGNNVKPSEEYYNDYKNDIFRFIHSFFKSCMENKKDLCLDEFIDNESNKVAEEIILDDDVVKSSENYFFNEDKITVQKLKFYTRISGNVFNSYNPEMYPEQKEYITSIELPDSITHIDSNVFFRNERIVTNLKQIIVPKSWSVKKVVKGNENYDFYFINGEHIFNLMLTKSMRIYQNGKDITDSVPSLFVNSSGDKAKTSSGKSSIGGSNVNFGSIGSGKAYSAIGTTEKSQKIDVYTLDIPNNVTKLKEISIDLPENIEALKVPDSVTVIGDKTFKQCKSLRTVYLSSNLNELGCEAFEGCSNLVSIALPNSLEKIGDMCFSSCSNLKEIAFTENLKEVGNDVFEECRNLKKLVIPLKVWKILQNKKADTVSTVDIPDLFTNLFMNTLKDCDVTIYVSDDTKNNVLKRLNSEFGNTKIENRSELTRIHEGLFRRGNNFILKDNKDKIVAYFGGIYKLKELERAGLIGEDLKGKDVLRAWFTWNDYKNFYNASNVNETKSIADGIWSKGKITIPLECDILYFNPHNITNKEDNSMIKALKSVHFQANKLPVVVKGSFSRLEYCSSLYSDCPYSTIENDENKAYRDYMIKIAKDSRYINKVYFRSDISRKDEKSVLYANYLSILTTEERGQKVTRNIASFENINEDGAYMPQIKNMITELHLLSDDDVSCFTKFLSESGNIGEYNNVKTIVIDCSISSKDNDMFVNAVNKYNKGINIVYEYGNPNESIHNRVKGFIRYDEGNKPIFDLTGYKTKVGNLNKILIDEDLIKKVYEEVSSHFNANSMAIPITMILPNDVELHIRGFVIDAEDKPKSPFVSKIKIAGSAENSPRNLNMKASRLSSLFPKLISFDFGENNMMKTIPSQMFEGCVELTNVILPKGLEEIEFKAFCNSGIEEMIIPDSVKVLGPSAFYSCFNLKTVGLTNKLNEIGVSCFELSGVESVIQFISQSSENSSSSGYSLSSNYTQGKERDLEIKDRAFAYCHRLTNLQIPVNTTIIGREAFSSCSKLINIEIPALVTRIKRGAFAAPVAGSEKKITLKFADRGNNPKDLVISARAFFGNKFNGDIYFPKYVKFNGNSVIGLSKTIVDGSHDDINVLPEGRFTIEVDENSNYKSILNAIGVSHNNQKQIAGLKNKVQVMMLTYNGKKKDVKQSTYETLSMLQWVNEKQGLETSSSNVAGALADGGIARIGSK